MILTALPGSPGRGRAVFCGWRIVSVLFLTHFISVGLVFYSYGVFLSFIGIYVLAIAVLLLLRLPEVEPASGRAGFE